MHRGKKKQDLVLKHRFLIYLPTLSAWALAEGLLPPSR
jgi:hypothetical protein